MLSVRVSLLDGGPRWVAVAAADGMGMRIERSKDTVMGDGYASELYVGII